MKVGILGSGIVGRVLWTPHAFTPVAPGLSPETAFGIFVAVCVAQAGSLFAADAWNNVTFTAGEVSNPHRNVPSSLFLGTFIVISLFLCVNLAYLLVWPFEQVQQAASDRVAATMFAAVLPAAGPGLIALTIMISAFGCMNGLLLSGARAYYAMANDRLFLRRAAALNRAHVPGSSLALQGAWAAVLVVVRTYNPTTREYGNLFSNLLEYVVSTALVFYILTISGLFRLRSLRPDAVRPYRAFGYPLVPLLYLVGAAAILGVLCPVWRSFC